MQNTTHGFLLKETKDLPEYRARGFRYIHMRTGLEAVCVENDDPEQLFSFIFRTLPIDSSGAAHILEHSTLSGSDRYPVHDPFMLMDRASVNTYMNAMTYPDKTLYLASSPLEKDFENLFSVYADAVFHPLLRKETFEQEGVRLSPEGKWEGVVFSEMQGASQDPDDIVAHALVGALYPDTCYRYISGGDPLSIADLTWEKYKEFYRLWYHPANCRLFLYGKNDVDVLLRELDETYLAGFGKGEALAPPSRSARWKAHDTLRLSCPREKGGAAGGTVALAWGLGDSSDILESATLNLLSSVLLDDPSCPLYRDMLESGLSDDISPDSGIITDMKEMVFIAGFKGIADGKEKEAENVIRSSLARIAREGIDKKAVHSFLKRARFKEKEIPAMAPQGAKILGRALPGWMDGKGPFATMEGSVKLDRLEEALAGDSRYLEKWIERNLLGNDHVVRVSVMPDEKYLKRQAEILETKAQKRLSEDTKKDYQEFQAFENTPDSDATLQKLPHLSLADLPQTVKKTPFSPAAGSPVPLLFQRRFTNGIDYLILSFDTGDLPPELFRLLTLYASLLTLAPVGSLSAAASSVLQKELFGSITITVDNGTGIATRKSRSAFTVQVSMLREDRKKAAEFLGDLLLSADVGNSKAIKNAYTDIVGDYRDNFLSGASSFAIGRAEAACTASAMDGEKVNGVDQWLWLAGLGEKPEEVLAPGLRKLQKILGERGRITACVTSEEEEGWKNFLPLFSRFAPGRSTLEGRPFQKKESGIEGFLQPTGVAFLAVACSSADPRERKQTAQLLLSQILTSGSLWTKIRMQGGAYGEEARCDLQEGLFTFATYRDPRIRGSLSDLRAALREIAEKGVSEQDLENAKITFVGYELKPTGPGAEIGVCFRRVFADYPDSLRGERNRWMLSVRNEDIKEAARDILSSLEKESHTVVFASREKLKGEMPSLQASPLPL